MGLRFDPVGGGQFKQALNAIVEAERTPIKQIESRKAQEDSKVKLLGEFKAKFSGFDKVLEEFTNFKKFRDLKAELGDGANYFSVTLDNQIAEPGSYEILIEQLAARSSVISNGFENADEPSLGLGFLVFDMPNGDSKEIFVDEENASLRGVASLINRTPNMPVRASVVKDVSDMDNPFKLIITAKQDGVPGSVVFPELYFLDGTQDIYYDDERSSQNALIHLDGFQIETESNDVKEFLQGINLHLKAASPDKPFTLTISEDYQKISGKVKALVDQVNGILEFINKQNQVDEKSNTRTTFAGDTTLQQIEYRIRNILHEGFPVGDPDSDDFKFSFLNEMGVQFEKNGLLSFKEDRFTKVLESDFYAVSEAITGKYGIASQLRKVIDGYTRNGNGALAIREQGLRNKIKEMDRQIADKERRLDQKQAALVQQFSRLEASLANMQRQSQYVQAQMGGGGGGGNLVQQLLGG